MEKKCQSWKQCHKICPLAWKPQGGKWPKDRESAHGAGALDKPGMTESQPNPTQRPQPCIQRAFSSCCSSATSFNKRFNRLWCWCYITSSLHAQGALLPALCGKDSIKPPWGAAVSALGVRGFRKLMFCQGKLPQSWPVPAVYLITSVLGLHCRGAP